MPRRPARPCEDPRCPQLVRPPHRRCPKHARIFHRNLNRAQEAQPFRIYGSQRWRWIRAQVVEEEPLCRHCHRFPTADVDHIVPLSQGGAPFDRSNLQGLCRSCHRKKTVAEAST